MKEKKDKDDGKEKSRKRKTKPKQPKPKGRSKLTSEEREKGKEKKVKEKKKRDNAFGPDFPKIVNEFDASVPADVTSIAKGASDKFLIPQDVENLALQKAKEYINENSHELDTEEIFCAEKLALGLTDEQLSLQYKVPFNKLQEMKKNPVFNRTVNQMTISTGVSDKMQRIRDLKGIFTPITEALINKANDKDHLESLHINTLNSLFLSHHGLISKLLGEDKEVQQVHVDVTLQLQKKIQESSKNKIIDIEEYNPEDDFPVIDVKNLNE